VGTRVEFFGTIFEAIGLFCNAHIWSPGDDFSYIFFRGKSLSAENSAEFLEKKTIFRNFFRGKLHFSQHFWGKIFRGIFPEIFPGKKCAKNRPQFAKKRMLTNSEKVSKNGLPRLWLSCVVDQGCQMFSGSNIPKREKYTR
jgi:hypothetical protein